MERRDTVGGTKRCVSVSGSMVSSILSVRLSSIAGLLPVELCLNEGGNKMLNSPLTRAQRTVQNSGISYPTTNFEFPFQIVGRHSALCRIHWFRFRHSHFWIFSFWFEQLCRHPAIDRSGSHWRRCFCVHFGADQLVRLERRSGSNSNGRSSNGNSISRSSCCSSHRWNSWSWSRRTAASVADHQHFAALCGRVCIDAQLDALAGHIYRLDLALLCHFVQVGRQQHVLFGSVQRLNGHRTRRGAGCSCRSGFFAGRLTARSWRRNRNRSGGGGSFCHCDCDCW